MKELTVTYHVDTGIRYNYQRAIYTVETQEQCDEAYTKLHELVDVNKVLLSSFAVDGLVYDKSHAHGVLLREIDKLLGHTPEPIADLTKLEPVTPVEGQPFEQVENGTNLGTAATDELLDPAATKTFVDVQNDSPEQLAKDLDTDLAAVEHANVEHVSATVTSATVETAPLELVEPERGDAN